MGRGRPLPGSVSAATRPLAWGLRRLRFSRKAAARRRSCLAFWAAFSLWPILLLSLMKRDCGATYRKRGRTWLRVPRACTLSGLVAMIAHLCGFVSATLVGSPARCRSSVVEHFIGNEEVLSSILSGSTRSRPICRAFIGSAGRVVIHLDAAQLRRPVSPRRLPPSPVHRPGLRRLPAHISARAGSLQRCRSV